MKMVMIHHIKTYLKKNIYISSAYANISSVLITMTQIKKFGRLWTPVAK